MNSIIHILTTVQYLLYRMNVQNFTFFLQFLLLRSSFFKKRMYLAFLVLLYLYIVFARIFLKMPLIMYICIYIYTVLTGENYTLFRGYIRRKIIKFPRNWNLFSSNFFPLFLRWFPHSWLFPHSFPRMISAHHFLVILLFPAELIHTEQPV